MADTSDKNPKAEPNENNANVTQKTTFCWETYIAEFNFTKAPQICFNQSPTPPKNEFEKGRLLVVPDLKGGDMPCLGSIQAVHGPWINIRLEGTDHSDDRWVMCDDSGIQAISGDIGLNPPVGYLHSLRGFHQWKDKQINTLDENGEGKLAKSEWFHSINRKYHPSKCYFQVGQKLEAIDQKNFSGVPHVATVVKVKDGMLTIHFDGWSSSYDIEEHYTSRALYPVGWSALAGLEVAAPSMQILRNHAINPQIAQAPVRGAGKFSTQSNRLFQSSISTQPSKIPPIPVAVKKPPPVPIQRLSDVGANPTNRPMLSKGKPLPPKPVTVPKPAIVKKRTIEMEYSDIPLKRISTVEPTARGSSEASSSANISSASVAGSPAVNGSTSPRPPIGTTTPVSAGKEPLGQQGVPTDVMLSCGDSVPMSQRSMTVFVNRHCRSGNLLSTQKIQELPRVIGPLSIHHVVREVVQQLINCGSEHVQIYRKVEAGPVKILAVTAQVSGFTNVRYIPIVKNVTAAWSYIKKLLQKIGCCPNLIADSPTPCHQCPISPDDVDDGIVTTSAASSSRHRSNMDTLSDASAETSGSGISSQPFAQWTMERVEEELSKKFEPAVVEKFKNSQIDGRALALLQTESIIKHMGIPLGPALRIIDFIETLRGQKPTSTIKTELNAEMKTEEFSNSFGN
ncbi:unnamed protein product, partial [Mesorhabditis belari]|uniref:SAM domain-containing protein n=1 Tax=Mesorhabditis belari TaxID=2138241 RepID=A0AAF3EWR6_9BILA